MRYDEGHEPPPQFYEQPELRSDLQIFWTAFNDLSTERQIGMGVGPIPRSKIKQYGIEELDIDCVDELDRFCAIISKMDHDYVEAANSTKKKKTGRGGRAEPEHEVAATDAQGVRQLFRNLKARKENETKIQKRKA